MIPGYLTFEDMFKNMEKYTVKKISQTLTFKDIYLLWINSYDKKGNPPKMSGDIVDISELFLANLQTNDDKEKTKNFLSFLYNNHYNQEWLDAYYYLDILIETEQIIAGNFWNDRYGVYSALWNLISQSSFYNLLKPGNVLIKRLKDKRNIDLIKLYKTLEPYKDDVRTVGKLVYYIDHLPDNVCLADAKNLIARGIDAKTILNAAAACNIKLSDEFIAELKNIQPGKVDKFKKAVAKAVTQIAVKAKTKKIDTQKKR